MSETKVTITRAEYDELLDSEYFLSCLEAAGVDNWQGYEFACDMYKEDDE